MIRWALLILALFSAVAGAQPKPVKAPPPPAATPEEVQLRVGAGLTGDWSEPGWVAVEVAIDHPLPVARQAELVLTLRREGPRWIVRRQIQLPARGGRREWLQVPVRPGSVSLHAEVWTLDADGEPGERLAEAERAVTVTTTHPTQRTILFVSDRPTARQDAAGLVQGEGAGIPIRVRHRRPDDLPEAQPSLRDLDLIVLHDVDLSRTGAEQRRALTGWVRAGGNVLLVPGKREGWFKTPTIAELTGGGVQAYRVNRMPEMEKALGRLIKRGESREDFFVFALAQSEQVEATRRRSLSLLERRRFGHTYSLLQRRSHGQGEVFLLATDLTLPPFDRWKGQAGLLAVVQDALERLSSHRRERGAFQRRDPFERPQLGDLLDSNERPSTLLVVLMVMAYLICVGPLNVALLRKRRAPLLLALTVPAVALLFTGLAIAAGFVTKGLGTVVWRASVISAAPGDTRGLEQSAVSLRSSVAGQHTLRFAPGMRATRVFRRGEDVSSIVQTLRDDEGFVFRDVRLDTWEQGVFEASTTVGLGKGLSFSAQADGSWRIDNGSSYAIIAAVLLDEQDRLHHTGPIAAGATAAAAPGRLIPSRTVASNWIVRTLCAGVIEERVGREALDLYCGAVLPPGTWLVARLERSPTDIHVDGDADADREVCLVAVRGGS